MFLFMQKPKRLSQIIKHALVGVIAVILAVLLKPHSAKAQEQFETSYDITYQVNQQGETTVTQKIKIENLEEDILATTYSVTVKQMDIYDISGSDTAGNLEINTKRDSEQGTIALSTELNEKVIGKGRANELTITYKTKDLANKVGNIWNINLPRTANVDEVKKYDVALKVPDSFGPVIFISPNPKNEDNEGTLKVFKYSKEELSGKSITAAFGSNQYLNFKLNYHLENPAVLPGKQEIALPPSIKGQQEVYYEKLTPRPESIRFDKDGNVMAIYKIKPNSDLQIELVGTAKTFAKQINPEYGGKMAELPDAIVKTYTQDQIYWEVEAPKIQEIAEELFDPDENVAENAQNAYGYVTENLEYNYDVVKEDFIERQGALGAITREEPWACMEFTDLFIALTRAMGIPARELNGYAFSNTEDLAPVSVDLKSGDMLHAWAEFYDPNFGWVPVDPTWGSTSKIDYFTKLDTNHMAFVVKGVSSEYPFPAGSYRTDPDEKQVNIDFAEQQRDFTPRVEIDKKITWNPLKLFANKRKYEIKHLEGPVLKNLSDTGKDLLPFEKRVIYLDKNADEITYQDYNNVTGIIPLKMAD
ncbi:hypothetical protein GF360_02585 [candidate division WWE3 bacterium]|nr:hypothetical protein [candidate division WWE3 bacterium]